MAPASLRRRDRVSLALQREVGRLLAPLWVPVCVAIKAGFGFGDVNACIVFEKWNQPAD